MSDRVFADLNNADRLGRVRLNCVGSIEDLARQKIQLAEGRQLTLYCEDLEADAIVRYSPTENMWVAEIDWDAIRRSPSPQAATPQAR